MPDSSMELQSFFVPTIVTVNRCTRVLLINAYIACKHQTVYERVLPCLLLGLVLVSSIVGSHINMPVCHLVLWLELKQEFGGESAPMICLHACRRNGGSKVLPPSASLKNTSSIHAYLVSVEQIMPNSANHSQCWFP